MLEPKREGRCTLRDGDSKGLGGVSEGTSTQ